MGASLLGITMFMLYMLYYIGPDTLFYNFFYFPPQSCRTIIIWLRRMSFSFIYRSSSLFTYLSLWLHSVLYRCQAIRLWVLPIRSAYTTHVYNKIRLKFAHENISSCFWTWLDYLPLQIYFGHTCTLVFRHNLSIAQLQLYFYLTLNAYIHYILHLSLHGESNILV